MKVKELIEELQKCNPDSDVKITYETEVIETSKEERTSGVNAVNVGNPASCTSVVEIILQ